MPNDPLWLSGSLPQLDVSLTTKPAHLFNDPGASSYVNTTGNPTIPPASLLEVMQDHADRPAADLNLACWDTTTRSFVAVSYAKLVRQAYGFGQRLIDHGLQSQSVCMIACHSPHSTLVAFYGAISAGLIPMIFPMPKALGSHDALTQRIQHWSTRFQLPTALVLEEGLDEKFHGDVPESVEVLRVPGTMDESSWSLIDTPATNNTPLADDFAFFQTTSSSTGDHKAVAISHGNVISNVTGIKTAVTMSDNERMISWLPLFHDMGLVGAVLFSFCNRYPLFLMTPVQFVKRPALWLKGMSEHRCTIATAPNFGYDYCARLVSDKDAAALDLHCVKHLFIGAEPIRVSTIQSFVEKFRDAGISESKMRPAYGLAESTIITSISLPAKPAKFICFNAEAMGLGEPVVESGQIAYDAEALRTAEPQAGIVVSTAGAPIEGMQVDLVDENGNSVAGEGVAGEIVLTGPSVAIGYVGDKDQLVNPFEHGRMHTGDMGVLLEGELYIIERIKNIIIRSGENYLVSAVEQKIADLLGTSHEHIAVFETDIHDPDSDIVVLVERHDTLSDSEVTNLLARFPQEGHPVKRLLFSRAREIARTTSGKKRHFYCRNLYRNKTLNFHQSIEISPEKIVSAIAELEAQGSSGKTEA